MVDWHFSANLDWFVFKFNEENAFGKVPDVVGNKFDLFEIRTFSN